MIAERKQRLLTAIDEGDGFFHIHDPVRCMGEPCVFHAPSDHKMRDWPKNLRETGLVERMCEHGIGHPDPDSLAYMETYADGFGTHGCDGCCRP